MNDLPVREIAGILRQTAWDLLSAADEFDPPVPAPTRAVCDVCGEETRVADDVGKRCKATTTEQRGPLCKSVARCPGTYRPDATRALAALAVAGSIHDRVKLGDGRTLGVDELAMEAALEEFLADDPDNDDGEGLPRPASVAGIANTYWGRS